MKPVDIGSGWPSARSSGLAVINVPPTTASVEVIGLSAWTDTTALRGEVRASGPAVPRTLRSGRHGRLIEYAAGSAGGRPVAGSVVPAAERGRRGRPELDPQGDASFNGTNPLTVAAPEEAKGTGERPERCFDPAGELTPQERRVAMLVADGATNREVAAALFMSPKTVEVHLTHIYRKLGVPSRTQLAREVWRGGPDDRALP